MNANTNRCTSCKGSHPADATYPGPVVTVEVDSVRYTLTLCPPYGNQWTFPHPDGSTGHVILFGPTGIEAMTCQVREILAGPHPDRLRTATDVWHKVFGWGDPRLHQGDTDASRLRRERIRAAYRLAYGVKTDLEAVAARGRDEAAYHMYATPADRLGTDHRARRYLAAYAEILTEAATFGERIYPVESLAYAYGPEAVTAAGWHQLAATLGTTATTTTEG